MVALNKKSKYLRSLRRGVMENDVKCLRDQIYCSFTSQNNVTAKGYIVIIL